MSLPSAWVDRIFEKLSLVYGTGFTRRWDGLDAAKVKADWAHELRGLAQAPQAIAHGLAHLPTDSPPTVLQFRQLCQRAPQMPAPELPSPPPDPQRVAQALAQMSQHRQTPGQRDPKAWAWALKAREERDRRSVTRAQAAMWRTALEHEIAQQQAAVLAAAEGVAA